MLSYRQLVSAHSIRKEQLLMEQKSQRNDLIQRQSRELEIMKLNHKIENDILKEELNVERKQWSGSKIKKHKSHISLNTPKDIDAFLAIDNSASAGIVCLHENAHENKENTEPLSNNINSLAKSANRKKINLEKIIDSIGDDPFDLNPMYQSKSTIVKRKLINLGFESDDDLQNFEQPLASGIAQHFNSKKAKFGSEEDDNCSKSTSNHQFKLKQESINNFSELFLANYNQITETADLLGTDREMVEKDSIVGCIGILDKSISFDQEIFDQKALANSTLRTGCEDLERQDNIRD